ncbi:metal dependent phosphohydrolase [Pirellula staleyi DSM 6068]|uniref:Metal dependent phosphohydrolase n=1 Tax=Pirellula staleyi (strain ATCC 27377 / DSM 6068 / ICPB 4128) TaxID=530564 RepID=D2R8V2_PIRSD|nr:HD domain-containing protein [Pirellula staleyi]ADB19402.1 metal dependent phosphohydrolase [Pirellula staleyi DSM 6068]
MSVKTKTIVLLSDLEDGQEGDFFAALSARTSSQTREGKKYWRVTFRDAQREVSFPIWNDSPWSKACESEWQIGECYKMRATYRRTQFGPQLEIRKIRATVEADTADGFDPLLCLAKSRFNPAQLMAQLRSIATEELMHPELKEVVLHLLETHEPALLKLPAARRNHHAFVGGWLEHVVSATRNAIFMADKYLADYPELRPPLSRDLVIAGTILHDIGKVHELQLSLDGADYTAAGELIGHILLGRDMLRDAAREFDLEGEMLLRLEHIIVSHQRLAEWGSPKPPMTPEAMLVHYCDDIDAKFHTFLTALEESAEGEFTSTRNPMQYRIFRGSGL